MASTDVQTNAAFLAGLSLCQLPASPHATAATPGPPGLISFDHTINPLDFLGELICQYGDVVRYQTRFGHCFLFVHPEHVHTILHRENYRRASLIKMMLGDGLLASDGPHWRSQRRLMQPDFLPAKLAPWIEVMRRETARTAVEWRIAARAGAAVDVTAAMTKLTLRIVVQALFSDELSEEQTAGLCSAITQTIDDLGALSWTVFGAPVRITPAGHGGFLAGKAHIDAVCHDMIARRRAMAQRERPGDLLTLLMEANDGKLSDSALRDELVTMLVGGHETTALVLGWAWKAIAEHPAVETKLHAEADACLGQRAIALADLPRLNWTRATFQEAMRLYPPVWYMARAATEADVVHGHAIPRGACVLVSAWFTHRHEQFWPNPHAFDPVRFEDPAFAPAHRYAYFPFGGGRHQCLGMHFAMMEGVALLADLARQFRVRPLPGQNVQASPGITLRQSPSMLARIEVRQPPPIDAEAP